MSDTTHMSATAAAPLVPTQGTRFMVQWEEHPMHLATRLGYLLEHQSLVDVTLMCNTHTLKVHRTVLAACSPYFETVLQRQLGNHPLIVLKDMKFCVLKSLIEFMYCGETSVTEENLNPLMEAAKFFEVKGLCTMSKEVLGGDRSSPTKPATTLPVNGTNTSLADIIPSSTYRGRGRRPGVGRGRRNLSTMLIPPQQGAPQAETAQIMLSLSGNSTGPTLQTTSRNVRISPNSRMGRTLQSTSSILDSKLMRNGNHLTDLKALREQLNLEPRRRGRRRQNFGLGRSRLKDLVDGKFGLQNIKKEADDLQQKDGILFKPLEAKVNLMNNNGNNDAKSPLLASLLSKAEALAKAKVKTENETDDGHISEQETVLYQFDGESSGETKYLDALKEAGLPTDVPVLIDNGDGNYVTLTEDVLMNVLGNNEEFQFQVTEATLEHGDISEGVVLQDGTIMMTGKNGKSEVNGPLLTVSKKPVTIKGKRGPKPKQFVGKDNLSPGKVVENDSSPEKTNKNETPSKKSVQELINEAVLESLKNGAANEAENDPDAVVLFEVTDNNKVCKYVVSSKEVNALKALNEQIKKQNSPGEKKSPLSPTVIDGNTNIAEIKLTVSKNSRKSIVSEVLARAHSLENQTKNNMLNEPFQASGLIKNEVNSPQMLDINIAADVLNDSSQLININPNADNLENPNLMDLGDEPQMLDDENSLVVLNDDGQIMQINGQHDRIDINNSDNLIVDSENNQIIQHEGVDLADEPSEDSQLMQINENSQDGREPEDVPEDISVDDSERTITQASRDMPLLENESQLVELEFIDGNGKKIEGYKVEGTVLSEKEISELTRLSERGKDSDVIGLLNMVCEEAAAQDISNDALNDINSINENMHTSKSFQVDVVTHKNTVNQPEYSTTETTKEYTSNTDHMDLEGVQSHLGSRCLESSEMSLDERECQELSVEQALQAMMGDENSAGVENQEYSEQDKSPIDVKDNDQEDSVSQQLSSEPEHPNSFINFVYEPDDHPPNKNVQVMPAYDNPPTSLTVVDSETHILPDLKCNNDASAVDLGSLAKTSDSVRQDDTGSTILISPTKDVPYAVGLVPLKDALVQIQSITEHQPRRTRSGSTSRSEGIGAKRRSSAENLVDIPEKRRKSLEEEDVGGQIGEEEIILST